MTQNPTLSRLLATPVFAAGSYLCVMILLLLVIASGFTDIVSQRAEVAGLRTMLEQFEGRKPAAGHGQGKPRSKQLDEATDIWSFVFWQLQVEPSA